MFDIYVTSKDTGLDHMPSEFGADDFVISSCGECFAWSEPGKTVLIDTNIYNVEVSLSCRVQSRLIEKKPIAAIKE